jgi:hypothetical protein
MNIEQECDLLQLVSYNVGTMSENVNNPDICLNMNSNEEKQRQHPTKRKFFRSSKEKEDGTDTFWYFYNGVM